MYYQTEGNENRQRTNIFGFTGHQSLHIKKLNLYKSFIAKIPC